MRTTLGRTALRLVSIACVAWVVPACLAERPVAPTALDAGGDSSVDASDAGNDAADALVDADAATEADTSPDAVGDAPGDVLEDGDAPRDAGDASVGPPSCASGGDGRSNCGASGNESCCTTLLVEGGTFSRSYDGVSASPDTYDAGYYDPEYLATVSDFYLDRYEITVGRFRKFVDAVVAGWTPASGAGKHSHLNGGAGLNASGGGYEPGWDTAWNALHLPQDRATWGGTAYLSGPDGYAVWTPTEGAKEQFPINCIDWFQAEAFCIWDGGFLPSEAEWNYAAAGGAEQRVYPWSNPPSSTQISCANANHNDGTTSCVSPPSGSANRVGSESPLGDGRWGQSDLAGNVYEWQLDGRHDPYFEKQCTDCAYLADVSYRVIRGASFFGPPKSLIVSYRSSGPPTLHGGSSGARCARPAP